MTLGGAPTTLVCQPVGVERNLPEGVADLVVEHMSDMVLVIDSLGRIAYANHTGELVLGWSREDWVGRSAFDLVHPDDVGAAAESLATASTSGPGIKQPIELRVRDADGGWHPVEIITSNLLDEPTVRGLVVVARDLSARADGLEVAAVERRRFERVFDQSPIGLALVGPDDRIVRLNDALARLGARSQADLAGSPLADLPVEDDRDRFGEFLAGCDAAADPDPIEVRVVDVDERVRWVRVSISPVGSGPDEAEYSVFRAEDVSEEHALREQLLYAATHDDLTGLLNRTGFHSVYDHVVERDRSSAGAAALVFVDLDDFKEVNDRHGHEVGDQLLEVVAGRIRRTVRTSDAVARIGGDEFLVLLDPLSEPTAASDLAGRVLAAVREPVELSVGVVRVGASIGVTPVRSGEPLSAGLNRADSAAYDVKRSGGNAVAGTAAT